MIKEALDYLNRMAAENVKPVDLGIPDPLAKRYMVGSQVVKVDLPAAPKQHSVYSLGDFVAMAEEYHDEYPGACVFVRSDAVVCVLDNIGHRVTRFVFTMEASDVWATVGGMSNWKNQKDFIRLLKIDLAGCLPENQLLDTIRKIKFENGVTVTQEVKKNRESLGREITSKVESPLDIPDYVLLTVPVYKSLGEREVYGIKCSMEVDPTRTDAFRLAPLPDEIERVQYLAIDSILERLKVQLPEGVPCYYGSP
jgi:hypothetical protein